MSLRKDVEPSGVGDLAKKMGPEKRERSQSLGVLVASLTFPLKKKEKRLGHVQNDVSLLPVPSPSDRC